MDFGRCGAATLATAFFVALTEAQILELIEQQVQSPASMAAEGHSITNRSVDELRKLLELVRENTSANLGSRGLRFTRLIPPGGGGGTNV